MSNQEEYGRQTHVEAQCADAKARPAVSEYTPGPWLTEPFADDLSVYIASEDGRMLRVAYVNSGYWFLQTEYGLTGSERTARANAIREANARLIAAAPELLEALKLILPLAKGYAPEGQSATAKATCRSWIEAAEAAIAKATGAA